MEGAAEAGDEGWAALQARWGDDEAHRAYLAGAQDLAGLTEVGRRYREALERRPDDAVALRWRDEIVKRASVLALAQLPRTRPPRAVPRWLRMVGVLVAALLVGAAVAVAIRLFQSMKGSAP